MGEKQQGGWPLDRRRDMFGKWDFVRKFMEDPCDAPWTAYALSMAGAALEAFVLLNQFDPSDIFWEGLQTGTGINRGRSRRKGIRGAKSTRFKVLRRAGAIATFDPHSIIGRYIGKFSPIARKAVPGPVGALWLLFNILEFLNFIIFLAEVIAQFFFRWTSLLHESKYCSARDDAVILTETDPYVTAALFDETPLIVHRILKQRGPITRVGAIFTIPKGWSGVVTCSYNWYSIGEIDTPYLRVFIRNPAWGEDYISNATERNPDGNQPGGISWEVSDGGTFSFTSYIPVGFAVIDGLNIYAQATRKIKSPGV